MPVIDALPATYKMPTELRRAAINHASGKVKGWYTLLKQWEQGRKTESAPQLGEPDEPPAFYASMVDYPAFDLLPQRKKPCVHLSPSNFGMTASGRKCPCPSSCR